MLSSCRWKKILGGNWLLKLSKGGDLKIEFEKSWSKLQHFLSNFSVDNFWCFCFEIGSECLQGFFDIYKFKKNYTYVCT